MYPQQNIYPPCPQHMYQDAFVPEQMHPQQHISQQKEYARKFMEQNKHLLKSRCKRKNPSSEANLDTYIKNIKMYNENLEMRTENLKMICETQKKTIDKLNLKISRRDKKLIIYTKVI